MTGFCDEALLPFLTKEECERFNIPRALSLLLVAKAQSVLLSSVLFFFYSLSRRLFGASLPSFGALHQFARLEFVVAISVVIFLVFSYFTSNGIGLLFS